MTKLSNTNLKKKGGPKNGKTGQAPSTIDALKAPPEGNDKIEPVKAVDPKSKIPDRIKKNCSWWKGMLRRMSLRQLLLLYTLLGGAIFQKIESENEDKNIRETEEEFTATVKLFCENVTMSVDNDTCFNETSKKLNNTDLWKRVVRYGTDEENTTRHWTFMGSVFFSSTVYTVIGYGQHHVPETLAGKIATMLYASFGIPFVLLVVTDMGFTMERAIREIYTSIMHRIFKRWYPKKLRQHVKLQQMDKPCCEVSVFLACVMFYLYLCFGGGLFALTEGWLFYYGFYFCFQTLTTIGFGDLIPQSYYVMIFFCYNILGFGVISMCAIIVHRRMAHVYRKVFGHESEQLKAKLEHRF